MRTAVCSPLKSKEFKETRIGKVYPRQSLKNITQPPFANKTNFKEISVNVKHALKAKTNGICIVGIRLMYCLLYTSIKFAVQAELLSSTPK